MEKHLRKLIREEVHAILQIKPYSIVGAKIVYNELLKDKEGSEFDIHPVNNYILKTPMENLDLSHGVILSKLYIEITTRSKKEISIVNRVGGGIEDKAIKETAPGNNMFESKINITILNWDGKTNLIDKIEQVFNHELHQNHIFMNL